MTLHHVEYVTSGTTTCGRYYRSQVAVTGYWSQVTCRWCLRARPAPLPPATAIPTLNSSFRCGQCGASFASGDCRCTGEKE